VVIIPHLPGGGLNEYHGAGVDRVADRSSKPVPSGGQSVLSDAARQLSFTMALIPYRGLMCVCSRRGMFWEW
jgi:hypothetical protein